jgi:hypothetical protein
MGSATGVASVFGEHGKLTSLIYKNIVLDMKCPAIINMMITKINTHNTCLVGSIFIDPLA